MKAEDQDNTPGDVFGNITISGGNVGAIGGRGHQIQQGFPTEMPKIGTHTVPDATHAQGSQLVATRDLLLDAFTAADLRRLFEYSTHPELKDLAREFGEGDGLVDMADKAIAFCRTRDLLPDLLAEVARVRPRPYARHRERVEGGDG